MRRTLSATVVGLLSVPVLALSAGTAAAGTSVVVDSSNGSSQAHFHEYGEGLYACDTASDGLRAVAIAYWYAGGTSRSAEVQDTNGANNDCAGFANLSVPEGVGVTVFACARNGANGALQFCSSKVAVA
jgi:hypothetical protein